MAFASEKSKAVKKPVKGKGNLPDNQLVIKVSTSKGYVTLGKLGLYNESTLHAKVAQLSNEQLVRLLSNAELSIVPYSSNVDDDIELVI